MVTCQGRRCFAWQDHMQIWVFLLLLPTATEMAAEERGRGRGRGRVCPSLACLSRAEPTDQTPHQKSTEQGRTRLGHAAWPSNTDAAAISGPIWHRYGDKWTYSYGKSSGELVSNGSIVFPLMCIMSFLYVIFFIRLKCSVRKTEIYIWMRWWRACLRLKQC